MRLFVALDIPAELKSQLLHYHLPDARNVRPENMHLTLKYLGEVPDEKVEKIIAALQEVKFSTFPLTTTKIGSFSTVLWLGVKLTKHLAQLQQDVARAVRPFTTHDPRPFKPHITIARFDRLSATQREKLDDLLKQRLEVKWKADRFLLMKSELAAGPVYKRVHEFSA